MLGYVSMNYSPKEQPIRTLLPGRMIPIAPSNGGPAYETGFSQRPDNSDDGDQDLRNFNSKLAAGEILFGRDYAKVADNAKGTGNTQDDFDEHYKGPFAQSQRLRNNLHFNKQNLVRRIASPDIQSQFETGYTLPLQEFAFVSSKLWNTPAGRNVAGTPNSQPSLNLPAPSASIPTSMPWNVSAPGGPY